MSGHWEELAGIFYVGEKKSETKNVCFLSRQFLSDWRYLRMADEANMMSGNPEGESVEDDVPAEHADEGEHAEGDGATPGTGRASDPYRSPIQEYSEEFSQDIEAMRAMGLPLSFTNRQAIDIDEEEWVATARGPPPQPAGARSAAAPVTSSENAVTSPRPELDTCVTSPYSAASGTSEQTEQTEESVPSPGGLEWLRCDYGGGRGEPSLEWQVCEPPESAALQSAWQQHWTACGEAEVLRTWTEKYRDYIDPAYLEATQGDAGDGACSGDGQETPAGAENNTAATGQQSPSVSEEQTTEDEPSNTIGHSHSSEADTVNTSRRSDATDPVLSSNADTANTNGDAEARPSPAEEERQYNWDELWQQHYQEVYDRMLAAFTESWKAESEAARAESGAEGGQSKRLTNGEETAGGRVVDGSAAVGGKSVGNETVGEAERIAEVDKQTKDGKKKKRNMSSRKAREMRLTSVGALLQQLATEPPAQEAEPAQETGDTVSSDVADMGTAEPAARPADADSMTEAEETSTAKGAGQEEGEEEKQEEEPDRSRPGTLAHAEGALTMLGFCHAPPSDDVIRPKAAHVIYRQKRLKQKTRQLNMTKTAFKHDDLVKRTQNLLKRFEDTQSTGEVTSEPSEVFSNSEPSKGQANSSDKTSEELGTDSALPAVLLSVTKVTEEESNLASVSAGTDDTRAVDPAADGNTNPASSDPTSDPVADPSSDPSTPVPAPSGGSRGPRGRGGRWAGTKRRRPARPMPEEMSQSAELQKYWYQRYRLFSRFDEGVRLSGASWFSVTPERIARHLAERCRADLIVDAFCGAGGNAIQFAHTCERVIAVDIDPAQLELARHNAAVYGVQDRIEFVLGDFFQLASRLRADAVFLSPPWGGPLYCDAPVYDVYRLDGVLSGRAMMRAARRVSPNVALLAPRNADVHQLTELAGPGGRVEIEQNLLNGKIKTITAYYGDLIACGGES